MHPYYVHGDAILMQDVYFFPLIVLRSSMTDSTGVQIKRIKMWMDCPIYFHPAVNVPEHLAYVLISRGDQTAFLWDGFAGVATPNSLYKDLFRYQHSDTIHLSSKENSLDSGCLIKRFHMSLPKEVVMFETWSETHIAPLCLKLNNKSWWGPPFLYG